MVVSGCLVGAPVPIANGCFNATLPGRDERSRRKSSRRYQNDQGHLTDAWRRVWNSHAGLSLPNGTLCLRVGMTVANGRVCGFVPSRPQSATRRRSYKSYSAKTQRTKGAVYGFSRSGFTDHGMDISANGHGFGSINADGQIFSGIKRIDAFCLHVGLKPLGAGHYFGVRHGVVRHSFVLDFARQKSIAAMASGASGVW